MAHTNKLWNDGDWQQLCADEYSIHTGQAKESKNRVIINTTKRNETKRNRTIRHCRWLVCKMAYSPSHATKGMLILKSWTKGCYLLLLRWLLGCQPSSKENLPQYRLNHRNIWHGTLIIAKLNHQHIYMWHYYLCPSDTLAHSLTFRK